MSSSNTIAIDDRDLDAVSYTGNWVVGGTEHEHDGTVSSSTNVGDFFTVTFTGTHITVFGTYDSSSKGVNASYSIDSGAPNNWTSTSSGSGLDTYQQKFYESGDLDQGEHKLKVTMLGINSGFGEGEGTVWFDYFNVDGNPASSPSTTLTSSSASGTSSATASTPTSSETSAGDSSSSGGSNSNIGAIVGGVIGGLAVILGFLAFLLWYRKKRRYGAYKHSRTSSGLGTPTGGSFNFMSDGEMQQLEGDFIPTPFTMPHPEDTASSQISRKGQSPSGYSSPAQTTSVGSSIATDSKRGRSEVASSSGASSVGGTLSIAPVQHQDSGIRNFDPEHPVELPPIYSAT